MIKTLPAILSIVLTALKLSLIVAVRTSSDGAVLQWILQADRFPFWAAEKLISLSFDQRRILPTREEALAFDAALLAFTAVLWFALGIVLRRWLPRQASSPLGKAGS